MDLYGGLMAGKQQEVDNEHIQDAPKK